MLICVKHFIHRPCKCSCFFFKPLLYGYSNTTWSFISLSFLSCIFSILLCLQARGTEGESRRREEGDCRASVGGGVLSAHVKMSLWDLAGGLSGDTQRCPLHTIWDYAVPPFLHVSLPVSDEPGVLKTPKLWLKYFRCIFFNVKNIQNCTLCQNLVIENSLVHPRWPRSCTFIRLWFIFRLKSPEH